jgi:hypothetical protein
MADTLVSALPRTEIVRLSSTDLDHTRSLLNRFYYPVAVGAPNGPTGFAFDLHVIQLGPLTFGEVSFRTPATVVATELPGYHVTLPTVGSVLTRQAGSELIAGPERAAVFRPGHPVYSLHAARSSELDIKIDRGALESELESLLGRPIHGPIDLAPALSSVSGPGQSWSRLVRLLRDELDHPQSLIQHPLIAEQIRHSVLCGLLLCLPHRYRDELTAPARPGPPRAIRRAIADGVRASDQAGSRARSVTPRGSTPGHGRVGGAPVGLRAPGPVREYVPHEVRRLAVGDAAGLPLAELFAGIGAARLHLSHAALVAGPAEDVPARRHPVPPLAEPGRHSNRGAVAGPARHAQIGQYPRRRQPAVLGQVQQHPPGLGELGIRPVDRRPGQQGGESRQRLHHITRISLGIRQAAHASRISSPSRTVVPAAQIGGTVHAERSPPEHSHT